MAADAAVGVAEDADDCLLWFTSSYMGLPSSPLGRWSRHHTIGHIGSSFMVLLCDSDTVSA